MPDEIIKTEETPATATSSSEGQSEETPKPTGVVVDGKVYTEKEIKELEESRVNFQRDYTKKTTDLSEQRKELAKEREAIASEKARLATVSEAFRSDIEFFNTNSQDKWDGYQPQSLALLSEMGVTQRASPEMKVLLEKIEDMGRKIETIGNRNAAVSVEEQVDQTLGSATKLIDEKYIVADDEEVLAQIRLFHTDNERLPNASELETIVRKSHDKAIRRGVKPPMKEIPKDGNGTPPKSSGTPAAVIPEAIPKGLWDDRAEIRRRSEQWFKKREGK